MTTVTYPRRRRQNLAPSLCLGTAAAGSRPFLAALIAKLSWVFPFLLVTATASAAVVINEIFYNAPNDLDDLEYVELHNAGTEAVDLGGWELTRGLKFKFKEGTRLEPNGFIVLCRSLDRFKQFYDAPVAGTFKQALSNKGERIDLVDRTGAVRDSVKYADTAPWPMGADGFSGSLERICPAVSGSDPANWASSPLSSDRVKPAGTPGKPNANFSATLPPQISNVLFTPSLPMPNESITVEADVRDPAGVREVKLLYRIAGAGFEKEEVAVPMKKVSTTRYLGMIPGHAAGQLIRFRIEAVNAAGAKRSHPAEHEPRPALSSYVRPAIEPAKVPFGWIIDTTEAEFQAAQQRARAPGGRGGFGPGFRFEGGPAPDDRARMQMRFGLESGLDLSGMWFELAIHQGLDFSAVERLRSVFAAKRSARDKLIDDILEASNVQEKLKALPEIIQTFRTSVLEAIKPLLSAAEFTRFTEALQPKGAAPQSGSGPGGMPFPNPATMIKGRVNLEEAWAVISLKAELDGARFTELRQVLQNLHNERGRLIERVGAALENPESFRDIREQGDTLEQKLAIALKPLLSPAQAKQFDDWRSGAGGFAFGRRGGGPGTVAGGPRGGGPGGPGGPGGFRGFGRGRGPAAPTAHRSAFVYYDPATDKLSLFDFVQVVGRAGGQKVHFYKDQLLNQMSTVNLIFEFNEKSVLAEALAYEVYRRAGMAAPQSHHVRLWLNDQPLGYYLLVEQPNRAFLRRNQIRDDGNLYKLLWYERGVVGQHEKKTNTQEGHDDIVQLIEALQKTSGDAQWELIEKHFDVQQVATYFAVNTVLSHWDGFFNNYFTYHDVKGSKKWMMFPWDQDNTWGITFGAGAVFHTMPITFGMNGDTPPGQRGGGGGFGFGFGGAPWWRQPGYFSGPLLANPQFRKIFLARTREILEKVYNEQAFFPVIDALGERLKPEVAFRAEVLKSDRERAWQAFEQNLEALREHIRKRREFLLAQDEIKNAVAAVQ